MPSGLFDKKPLAELLAEAHGHGRLQRVLGPVALTSLGVGAIIGAGIFVLTGVAAHDVAGPSLVVSFLVAGATCAFAALCYAEFASMVPVAGSAYTYAYATLGELFAWIIGWDLVLEYAVGAAAVAHGWSHYFQDFIGIFGLHIPAAITSAPFDYDPVTDRLASTGTLFDLPALVAAAIATFILVVGIRESAAANTAAVLIKLSVVVFVIVVGTSVVDTANWRPLAPFGWGGLSLFGKPVLGGTEGHPRGMLAGAAMVFFAYIGFDSVANNAEEAKRPRRDVPIAIIASLLLCTALYVAVVAVLTGMVRYDRLDVDAPLSSAFASVGMPWAHTLVSFGALAGISSVLLVLMLSQPRVLLAMARDRLLPPGFFGAVHARFRTPWKSTIVTGVFVGILSALLPLRVLAELVNIGTLLAFVIVCAGVLVMRRTHPDAERPFRTPFVPAVPILGIVCCLVLMLSLPAQNWLRLVAWLAVGLVVYFAYGRRHRARASST